MKPHIGHLSWEQFVQLHRAGKIQVRARLAVATHLAASDPRIPGRWQYQGIGCLALIAFPGAVALFLYSHWVWGLAALFAGWQILNGTRQASAQAVCAAILEQPTLYYDCLQAEALYIYES